MHPPLPRTHTHTHTCGKRVTLSPSPCHLSSSSHLAPLPHAAGCHQLHTAEFIATSSFYSSAVVGRKVTRMPLGERSQGSPPSICFADLNRGPQVTLPNPLPVNSVFLFISTSDKHFVNRTHSSLFAVCCHMLELPHGAVNNAAIF